MKGRPNTYSRVYTIGSSYALLLCLLLYGVHEDDAYIFNGYVVSERIVNNLSKFCPTYTRKPLSSNSSSLPNKILSGIAETKRYRAYLKKNANDNTVIIGHDHLLAISYPLWGKYSVIVEDGYLNSLEYNEMLKISNAKGSFRYKMLNIQYRIKNRSKSYRMYGFDPSVEKIYLTQNEYSDEISSKVEVISLKAQWGSLDNETQAKIREVFIPEGLSICSNTALIITQPLAEDHLMSEDEKIAIYRNIIEREENVIIKPHPRENTQWNNLFPNVQIIPNDIPIEILSLVSDPFTTVYTCFSSAISCFEGLSKLKYISMLRYPDIVKRYRLNELYDSGVEIIYASDD